MSYQKCKECRYYVDDSCHRHPPQISSDEDNSGVWPSIIGYDPCSGCGDGEPRESEPRECTASAVVDGCEGCAELTEVAAWRAWFASGMAVNEICGCYWVGASGENRPTRTYDSPEAAVVTWYVEREAKR